MGALENLRSKYPQYDNIDDNTLIEKVVTKYPQYKDALKPSEPSEQSNSNPQQGFTMGVPNMPQAVSNIPSIVESQRVTNRESAAIPAEFVNEYLLGLPKYAVNKIAGEGSFPEAESTVGKVLQVGAGLAGMIKSPVNKLIISGANKLIKGTGALKSIARNTLEGAAMGAAYTPIEAQQKGEGIASAGERVAQGVLGGGIGLAVKAAPIVAGKAIENTGKAIKAPMKVSRWLSDRLMDTSLGMKKSDRAKFLKDNYASEDASQWANDRGLFGNQEQIAEKLDSIKKQSYDALNSSIEGVKGTHKNETTQRVLNKIKEHFNKSDDLTEYDVKLSNEIDSLYQKSLKDGLTLSENLKVKRLMDEIISPFKPAGDIKGGVEWEKLSRARNEIKTFIEDVASINGVKNVRDLSKDIQLSTLMSKAIKAGNVTGKTNRMLDITDFILTAALRDPILSTLGVGAKKIAEMPSVKTKVASFLRNLSGDELKQFEVMKMNGKQPESSVYKNIVNYIKQVGLNLEKTGKNLYSKQEESRKVAGLLPSRPHVMEMPNAIPVGKGSPKYPNALTKEMEMLPEEVVPVKEPQKTGFTVYDHHKNVPAIKKPMTVSEWRAKQRFQTKGKPYTPKEEEKIIDAEFVEHDTRTLPKRPLQIEGKKEVIALGNAKKAEELPVTVKEQSAADYSRKKPKTMKQKLIEAKTEKKAESVNKEPWEMTRNSFGVDKQDINSTDFENVPKIGDEFEWNFNGDYRNAKIIKIIDYKDGKSFKVKISDSRNKLPGTKSGSGKEIAYTSNELLNVGYHKNIIKKALSEGKQVPPEVLKDYPDLVKETTPKTMKQLKEKWNKPKQA